MILLRLLGAFQNVSPANTRIDLKNCKGNAVWSGYWNDAKCRSFYDLTVLDFEIDGLSATHFVQTLTVTVMEAGA